MVSEEQIRSKILASIPNIYNVMVTDLSYGCGQSFDVVVVSDSFVGVKRLARSRMVNDALKEELEYIHAFCCKCYTMDEWKKIVV